MRPPVYLAKVITLAGVVIASPLPVASVRFTRRVALPGQQALGEWSIELLPALGAGAHYDAIYKQLDYKQRVEIYEDEIVGDPVFAGYIDELPSDLGRESISGPEWVAKLGERKLAHYQTIVGKNITDQIVWLLNSWQPLFKENFNRAAIGTNWTISAGTFDILRDATTAGQLRATGSGPNWQIQHTLALPTPDAEFRAQIDIKTGPSDSTWQHQVTIFYGGSNPWILTIAHVAAADEFIRFTLEQPATVTTIQRDASVWEVPFAEWCTVDLWSHPLPGIVTRLPGLPPRVGPSRQGVEVWLNGRQFLLSEVTAADYGFGGALAIATNIAGVLIDNAIIWTRQPVMKPGYVSGTLSTDTNEYPQDTHLQALSYLVDILDWEWRTTAKAGAGNDTIDIRELTGEDVSSTIKFEEGKNLVNLNLAPSGQKLCTLLSFLGQGQDENQRLAQSYDFDAWDRFGIIEDSISDARISTNSLARQKADNELVKRKDGTASLSATVIDSPTTINQWREGDTVWVKAIRPDINQTARIMEVEYTSGSLERRVTFDKFPRSRSGQIGRLMDDVGYINRGTRGNAGNVILHYKPGPRWVDDFDPRIRYVSSDTVYKWQSWTGGLAEGAYGATLHGTSSNKNYLELDFEGSGIAVVCRTGPNLVDSASGKYLDIYIDGTLVTRAGLKSSSNIDQVVVWSTTTLTSGPHTIKLQRGGGENLNIYIDLDAFRLYGWFWQFFLEGRAVNSAELSWTSSNSTAPMLLKIDGTDRTSALGGPWSGDVINLDVHPYLSAPGLHSVEFINSSTTKETMIEATLVSKVLV